jgi:hypothetical protein
MRESTIELGWRERLGAWLYTGPVGRLVSFSIDLALALAALCAYAVLRVWRRLRSIPRRA